MDKLDVAIICSAIPVRKELLKRSLVTWDNSILSSGLNAKIFLYLENKEGWNDFYPYEFVADQFLGDIKLADRSGSHIAGYNFWLEEYKVESDVYLFTHPDILFPAITIETVYQLAIPNRFVGFKVFWIPEGMTNEIDKYNWRKPETLETESDLFPPYFSDDHGEFYWNSDVRSKMEWHSTTTWAMDKATVEKLRPFPDFNEQGADDCWFYGARMRLGIEDYCVQEPILFHQHHPQTWNQDVERAVELANKALIERFGA